MARTQGEDVWDSARARCGVVWVDASGIDCYTMTDTPEHLRSQDPGAESCFLIQRYNTLDDHLRTVRKRTCHVAIVVIQLLFITHYVGAKRNWKQQTALDGTEYPECPIDLSGNTMFDGTCGDDPLVDARNTTIPVTRVWPEGCNTYENQCLINRRVLICLCSDGIYKTVGNVTSVTPYEWADSNGRMLYNAWRGIFRLDSHVQTFETFVYEVRPLASSLWTSPPWIGDYAAAYTDTVYAPHPRVTKGRQVAASIDRGRSIAFHTTFFTQDGNSAVMSQYRVFKAYETSGVAATPVSMLFMVKDTDNLVLENPRAICNAPIASLSTTLGLTALSSVNIGASLNTCSDNYASCTQTYTLLIGTSKYKYKACTMEMVNFANLYSRWFTTGWDIAN
jgi:hypothetical protein